MHKKRLLLAVLFGLSLPALALPTLTLTPTYYEMHVGQGYVPRFTWTAAGWQNGDAWWNSVTGRPSCTNPVTPASPVGTYTTTCTVGSLASSKYTFAFATNTIAVVPADGTGTTLTPVIQPSGAMPTVEAEAARLGLTLHGIDDASGNDVPTVDDVAALNTIWHDGGRGQGHDGGDSYEHPKALLATKLYGICGDVLKEWGNRFRMVADDPTRHGFYILDSCPRFHSGTPVSAIESDQQDNANQQFLNRFEGMAFFVGPGNPDIIGLLYSGSNSASIYNSEFASDDCTANTLLSTDFPGLYDGPESNKHLAFYCGRRAWQKGNNAYNSSDLHITLQGQTADNAIDSDGFHSFIEHLWFVGAHNALRLVNANNNVFHSSFHCTGSGQTAIAGNAVIAAEDIAETGCASTLTDPSGSGTNLTGPIGMLSASYWTGKATTFVHSLFGDNTQAGPVDLPEREFPTVVDPADWSTWIALGLDARTYEAKLKTCASSTAWVPNGTIPMPVLPGGYGIHVPPCIKHINMYGAAPLKFIGSVGYAYINWIVDGPSTDEFFLTDCDFACVVTAPTSRPIGLQHGIIQGFYPKVGLRVDIEELQIQQGDPLVFPDGSDVSAYTLDLEQVINQPPYSVDHLILKGHSKAVLKGYKTEHAGRLVWAQGGSQVNVFGSMLFPVDNQPAGEHIVQCDECALWLDTFLLSYASGATPDFLVQETHNGVTLSLPKQGDYSQHLLYGAQIAPTVKANRLISGRSQSGGARN